MPDSLPDLESRRAEIVKQFARLGDLRSGSISNTSGRCGKPNCHCHQPGQPVHGPNPRLTYKVQGRTVSEWLANPASQKKAEREIAEFRRFEQLVREFIEINNKICRARPVEEATSQSEEKRTTSAACEKAASQLEQQFRRIFADRHNRGQLDLESVEMAIRSTVHQTGADTITELLRFQPPEADHGTVPCPCGQADKYEGMRSRRS